MTKHDDELLYTAKIFKNCKFISRDKVITLHLKGGQKIQSNRMDPHPEVESL